MCHLESINHAEGPRGRVAWVPWAPPRPLGTGDGGVPASADHRPAPVVAAATGVARPDTLTVPMSLRSLPPLLRNEPAMTRVIGAPSATLAVATPA